MWPKTSERFRVVPQVHPHVNKVPRVGPDPPRKTAGFQEGAGRPGEERLPWKVDQVALIHSS